MVVLPKSEDYKSQQILTQQYIPNSITFILQISNGGVIVFQYMFIRAEFIPDTISLVKYSGLKRSVVV